MSYQPLNPEWVSRGIKSETIQWADDFSRFLVKDERRDRGTGPLTTSQIRKFFGQLKQIQADFSNKKKEIPLLRVKLAYAVGRDNNTKIKDFYNQLCIAINELDKMSNKPDSEYEKTFNNLVNLVESIVAFHKYHNGK